VPNIRPFSPADKTALTSLFEEMQRHYNVPCPPPSVIESNLAALPAGVEIMVAETDTIIGFAAFSAIYPGPGLRSGLFMKELFVTAGSRGHGVGKALIQAVARVASSAGTAASIGPPTGPMLDCWTSIQVWGRWRSTKRSSTASRAMRSQRWRRGTPDISTHIAIS
jgi:GNAT superfamily N-acetyltransferase